MATYLNDHLKTVKGHSNNTTNTKEARLDKTDQRKLKRIHHCDKGLFVIFIYNDRET